MIGRGELWGGQVLNKPQMRLLLKISGGSFYKIQTDIYIYTDLGI